MQYELFELAVSNFPLETALLQGSDAVQYQDLKRAAEQRCARLRREGIRSNDRVAIRGDMPIDVIVNLLALWKLEAQIGLLPGWLVPSELELVLKTMSPTFVIDNDRVLPQRHLKKPPDVSRACTLFPTSGTGGIPKLVAHSGETLMHALLATIALQNESLGEDPRSVRDISLFRRSQETLRLGLRFYSVAPLATIAGFTVIQRALLTGECLILAGDSLSPAQGRCPVRC